MFNKIFKLVAQNVRGLRDSSKRRETLYHFRPKGEILCFQETHSVENDESIWEAESGMKCFWSNGTNDSRGVVTMIQKTEEISVLHHKSDQAGRYVIVNVKIKGENYVIVNLYAPNKDVPQFFVEVLHQMMEFEGKKLVVGDFNLIMDAEVDRTKKDRGKLTNNEKSKEVVQTFMEEAMFTDIWRDRNPEKKQFTRRSGRPDYVARRIDMIICENSLSGHVKWVKIEPGYKSDHSSLAIEITERQDTRGKGVWKLNTRVLREIEYCKQINEILDQTNHIAQHLNPCEKWDTTKMRIIESSKQYCAKRAADKKLVMSQLWEKLEEWEEVNEENMSTGDKKLKERTKIDYQELIEEKTRGAVFRTKCNWYNESEKSTKYFLNLEKTKSGAKGMAVLIKSDGTETTDPREIQGEIEKFYRELYKTDSEVEFTYCNRGEAAKIEEEEREMLNSEITLSELAKAMKGMARNKSPGSDGLPPEFYIMMWNKLGKTLLEAIKFGLGRGKLHDSALKGIITLIPKPKKDPRDPKSMRPISLLNTDYKCLEKVFANRLKGILERLINRDQKGFLKGRRASTNIRVVLDLVSLSDEEGVEGLILSLDFFKCFDQVEIRALRGAMEYFGMTGPFNEWTGTLFRGATAQVVNKGRLTEPFPTEKGLKQGGCCSTYFFLICAEVLAIALRENENIKGLKIGNFDRIFGQFADDMDIYLANDQKSLDAVLNTLKIFSRNSGFKVNYDKTTIYRIGSIKHSKAQLYTKENLKYGGNSFNILGVDVNTDPAKLIPENYDYLINKAQAILKTWQSRNLSILGKVTVINSLVSSLFVYKMTVLPLLPNSYIKRIHKMLNEFMWNGRKAKISLEKLQYSKKQGGVNLVNFEWKDKALKISWVEILQNEPALAELAYKQLNYMLKENIWKCNLKQKDIKDLFSNSFWRDVLISWAEINEHEVVTPDQVMGQFYWLNSNIRIKGKPIFYKKCFLKHITHVSSFFDCEGNQLDPKDFCLMYEIDALLYNQLWDAIPKSWKKMVKGKTIVACELLIEVVESRKKLSQYAYKEIQAKRGKEKLVNLAVKWKEKLREEIDYVMILKNFRNIYKITNHSKLRSFQYRLLHRAIVLNKQLCQWKIVDDDLCSNCREQTETIEHFFFDCKKAQTWWEGIGKIIAQYTTDEIKLTRETVLMNTVHQTNAHVSNFIVLTAKCFMYSKRCLKEELKHKAFEQFLVKCKNFEYYNAKTKNSVTIYYKKWYGLTKANTPTGTSDEITHKYITDMLLNEECT